MINLTPIDIKEYQKLVKTYSDNNREEQLIYLVSLEERVANFGPIEPAAKNAKMIQMLIPMVGNFLQKIKPQIESNEIEAHDLRRLAQYSFSCFVNKANQDHWFLGKKTEFYEEDFHELNKHNVELVNFLKENTHFEEFDFYLKEEDYKYSKFKYNLKVINTFNQFDFEQLSFKNKFKELVSFLNTCDGNEVCLIKEIAPM